MFSADITTLTIGLDTATESTFDRQCAERGVTKSLVVQESLAGCLLADRVGEVVDATEAPSKAPPSANSRAFAATVTDNIKTAGRRCAQDAPRRNRCLARYRPLGVLVCTRRCAP